MAKKADGVIEAGHLSKDGELLWVRAYERRGPTWSDVVLLDRNSLIQRLRDGKRFFTGRRHEFNASEFTLRNPVLLIGKKNQAQYLSFSESQNTDGDNLKALPRL
jgi:hypothetical protein